MATKRGLKVWAGLFCPSWWAPTSLAVVETRHSGARPGRRPTILGRRPRRARSAGAWLVDTRRDSIQLLEFQPHELVCSQHWATAPTTSTWISPSVTELQP